MNKSQIETTKILREFVVDIDIPITASTLIEIRRRIFAHVKIRLYDESTKEHERLIRWKRTASQILEDGYVYQGKSCTDLTVLFIALCRILGLETRFVKLKKGNKTHSIAEIKISDGWYLFDVSSPAGIPQKGEVTKDVPYKDWQLWKKGRDAWDLDLVDFSSMQKIRA